MVWMGWNFIRERKWLPLAGKKAGVPSVHLVPRTLAQGEMEKSWQDADDIVGAGVEQDRTDATMQTLATRRDILTL
ncbi:hypothetical protein SAMN05444955_10736 [Lihuaxuella thermophila]|uniref:Uncharacterized protein n=1 Tax=Lihuaxuella thermophila TaxID=1173111 RepID=A0A1H8EJR3_9BACL|nr:hypothetical protein SAMN05444955_10736 [Lihuaxuella thermophila]